MVTRKFQGSRYDGEAQSLTHDALVEEAALHIRINGCAFSTLMRTPGHDEQLVRGLLYTENVLIEGAAPLRFAITPDPESRITARIDVEVAPEQLAPDFAERRSSISVSSCGLCGTARPRDIEIYGHDARMPAPAPLDAARVPAFMIQMSERQRVFDASGGSHAAAAFDADGRLLAVHEDIGRHSAVDKVVGALLEERKLDSAHCLTVSGRCSYEIVLKAYRAGIPFVAAVSAPSTLAVETAQRIGMTLLAFCRDDRMTAYANPHNLADAIDTLSRDMRA